MQRLADIDVAEPGHDSLIGERGLERGLLALACARQHRRVERVAERLGPERTQQRLLVELGARQRASSMPKRRGSLNEIARARRHVEHHVIVRERAASGRDNSRRACVSPPPCATRNEPDMPRCISSTSPDERSASRYLARRPSPSTVLPSSRATKSFGSGQRRSPRCGLDLGEARALHDRLQPAADGLDFGQFRHGHELPRADIASPRPARYGPAATGLFAMPRTGENTHFGFQQVPLERQAGAGRRRLSQRRAAATTS